MSSSLSVGAAAAPDWSVRGRLVEVSPVSASECFLLVALVGAAAAAELDDAPSSSSESTIMRSSSSSAGAGGDHRRKRSRQFVYNRIYSTDPQTTDCN